MIFSIAEVKVSGNNKEDGYLVLNMWISIDSFMRIYMVKGSKIRLPIELNKAIDGGLDGRPDTRIAENLYVVGDWMGKEGSLSKASVASAKRASELISIG